MPNLDEIEKIVSTLGEKGPSTGNVMDYKGNLILNAMPRTEDEINMLSNKQAKEFKTLPLSNRVELLENSIRALEEKKSEIPKLYCHESGRPIAACKDEFSKSLSIGRHLLKKLESSTSSHRGTDTEVLVYKPIHHLTFRLGSFTDLAKVVFSSIGSGTPVLALPNPGLLATAYEVKAQLSTVLDPNNIAIERFDGFSEAEIDLSKRRQGFMLAGDCDFERAAALVTERISLTHKPVYVFVDAAIADPFVSSVHESLKTLKPGDAMDLNTGLRTYDKEMIGEFLRQKSSVKREPKFGLQAAGRHIMPGLYLAGEFDRHIPNNISIGPLVVAFEYPDSVHGAHFANLLRMESASIFARDLEQIFNVAKVLDCPYMFSNSGPKEETLAEGIMDLMRKGRRLFLHDFSL